MCKDNIEDLKKEFKKELEQLDKKIKQAEEEKKSKVIYKNYYIERDIQKEEKNE